MTMAMGWLGSVSLVLQQVSLGLVTRQWHSSKRKSRSMQASDNIGLDLAHCHFYHIPLAKAG